MHKEHYKGTRKLKRKNSSRRGKENNGKKEEMKAK